MSQKNPVNLTDLFRYYKKLPHQNAALVLLQEAIVEKYPEAFNRDQPWYETWSSAVPPKLYSAAAVLIISFEGCHLSSYICPAGVPTIGYGNTKYPDGRHVKLGETITQETADKMLELEISRTVNILEESIPYWKEMNTNQQSALISFAFNLGVYFYGLNGFRSITRVLANKDWDLVPSTLMLYRNPGSHFEEGLKRRRIAEGKLWSR
jgi:GH24 family phage-related lysozyme (muramidase)